MTKIQLALEMNRSWTRMFSLPLSCTKKKKKEKTSLISSTFIRNALPAAPLKYISLINDLIKNTCGILKGVKFVPIQSDTFYLGASESRVSDIALAPRRRTITHWSVMSYKLFF